jgi:hypothetical protein
MNGGKTKIVADTAAVADGDTIVSYLSTVSALLTSTAIGGNEHLRVTTPAIYAEDTAHVSGDYGSMIFAVRQDTPGSLVSADGDYAPLQVDSTGALRVNAAVTIGDNKAEDSAHTTGDTGSFMLSVRNDNQATTFTSATGDYAPFATDSKGALYTKSTSNVSNLQTMTTVGTTATAVPATALANRTSMFVQHLTNGSIHLGSATVTTSGATRGFQLGNGGFASLDVGPNNVVYAIGSSANREVVTWEFV